MFLFVLIMVIFLRMVMYKILCLNVNLSVGSLYRQEGSSGPYRIHCRQYVRPIMCIIPTTSLYDEKQRSEGWRRVTPHAVGT